MDSPRIKDAKTRITQFCAYQERYHQEVRDKLYSYGLHPHEVEEMLSHLIQEDFLNEERFARTFAGGKFRLKKWGRRKIENELRKRKISEFCIFAALEEIQDEDYLECLKHLINRKKSEIHYENPLELKHKLARYLIGKGYESDIVWDTLNVNFRT